MYNKSIGSLIGGLLSIAVAQFGLPADWNTPEIAQAITLITGTLFVYFFPANAPKP
jgi:hypothetical protein